MSDPNREISGKVVLITGANGGMGGALIAAFTNAGASEVIAATRTAMNGGLGGARQLTLDVTDIDAVEAAAGALAMKVDILVNNAGVNGNTRIFTENAMTAARREMEANYFGTMSMIRAFAPVMKKRGEGVIVNMLTVLSHVNLPTMASYCASKAATLSLTQAARAELAASGVRVLAVLPGLVDTRMSERAPPPKLSPHEVAQAMIEGIRNGLEDIYPGEVATKLRAALQADLKQVERQMAARLPPA